VQDRPFGCCLIPDDNGLIWYEKGRLAAREKTDLLDLTTPNRVICISAGPELIPTHQLISQRPVFLPLQFP
jgi:hypothetical protein